MGLIPSILRHFSYSKLALKPIDPIPSRALSKIMPSSKHMSRAIADSANYHERWC